MRRFTKVSVTAIAGFLLLQVAKATGIERTYGQYDISTNDTNDTQDIFDLADLENSRSNLLKNDSIRLADPKASFTNMLTASVEGDVASNAKLNPLVASFVKNYIAKNKSELLKMKDWGREHLELMDRILTQHGIPGEMKYLAVIESSLKFNDRSWAGAVGPWQFMPEAARQYGLRISKGKDERMDFYKSTHAAARYLTDLYATYGDWLLVIAAYNCGPGGVNRAIRKGGSRDFWTIQNFLPNESMNHVKKFIGCHYIFEGEGGITTLTKQETKDLVIGSQATLNNEDLESSSTYQITGRFNSGVILKFIELDRSTFNKLNPGFDNSIAINGKYDLRLPKIKMNIFVAKRYEILDESIKTLLNTDTSAR